MAGSSKSLLDQPSKPSLLENLVKDDGNSITRKSRKLKSAALNDDFGAKHSTTAVPRSMFLDKAKNFLAALAEANRKLELDVREGRRADYDVEALRGDEKECIDMDLLLGVADLHTDEAVAAAEAAVGGFRPAAAFVSSSSSDSDDDSDEDGDSMDVDAKNSQPTCCNKNPKIVMLDKSSS